VERQKNKGNRVQGKVLQGLCKSNYKHVVAEGRINRMVEKTDMFGNLLLPSHIKEWMDYEIILAKIYLG
jgi:hypothetical protein